MGLCGSKSSSSENTTGAVLPAAAGASGGFGDMVTQGIQNYVMSLVVQRAAGSTGDTQMGFLKNLVGGAFPKASITEQVVQNAQPNMFNVLSGGELIHNTQQNGPVQQNAEGILSKLTAAATKQLSGGV